ncbi:immunoglobulin-like and fibronectin type III domain-containing protein 1 isoform X5 [Amia ocellicauda]|uniref:immunoglobulin-like and fibronectin type III domain-containing protein 1 isoform X5 n=1 Tax=Amia ocellicauda TaxID=2972642 RepID=UPI003463E6AB
MYQITPENCSHLRASQFPKMKTSKITNGTASGQGPTHSNSTGQGSPVKKRDAIKRRSKTGVIITQFTEELPDGCSFPDFERKPIALTIQEGKTATFKAIVKGNPKPEVTWKRVKGTMDDPNKFKMIYDKFTDEHALQVIKLTGQEADNYKCYATNDYGEAVCTAGLIVIEIGFKKKSMPQEENEATRKDPTEFRKLLRKRVSKDPEAKEEKVMDEKVWEILLSSDKKDYERICIEYGITDFRGMLKRLNEMKMEREEEQAKFIDALSNLKPIAVNKEGIAEFELDLELKDSNSRIFLYKDGVMIPFNKEMVMKHSLKQTGKKYTFSIKDLLPEDAGLYQVDVEDTTIFSTDLTFKAIPINFICPIKEVKAQEREDALFECVLSHPSASVVWMGKNKPIQSSEKYEITMSEDKLIHRLLVKDVMPVDKGIYAIVAGIRSSSAWLMVESTDDPSTRGKKKARKTTRAGGSGDLIESIAQEQAEKLKHLGFKPEDEGVAEDRAEAGARAGDVTGGVINGMGGQRGLGDGQGEPVGKSDDHSGSGPGKVENGPRQGGTGDAGASGQRIDSGLGSGQDIRGLTDDQNRKNKSAGGLGEPAVHFTSGLSDVHAQKGHAAELVCKLNSDQSEGVWFKDGQTLSSRDGLTISKEGACHDLTISKADESSSGKYRFEAEGCKTEAHVIVEEQDSSGLTDDQNRKNRRAGRGPLTEDTIVEPAVHFTSGLSDVHAQKGHAAELVCKLNSDQSEGVWFKDGEKLSSRDGLTISKEGACHKLTIAKADESSSGKYRFEAEGRKTEAHVIVEDPPVLSKEDIEYFSKPIAVKAGQNAELKMPFEGRPPFKVSWFRDGEELLDDKNVKVEMGPNHSRLLLTKCKRKNGGEIKVKIKNDNGTVEAMTNLVVLDKPSPPQGPVEVLESSPTCIEFKWRPPRDDGGAPVLKYSLERQQVGRNTWTKLGEVPGNTHSFATNQVEHGRKYCFRIQALTAEGASEVLETDEITAGMKAYPSPPAPPKVVSATSKCITLSWSAPHNTGGSRIAGYIVEKRKKGSNIWSRVSDEPIQERKFAVKDIVEGQQFEFRVSAINVSGAGEPSVPSDFIFARDPMKPPGKIQNLKVTDSSYTTLSLSWAKPNEDEGDAAKGYYVEIKSADSLHWRRCNAAPIGLNSYTIKGLKSMGMYFIRVVAANDGGEGEPQELQSHILAMPPPVRPRFLTDASVKSFMVVKAGNTVRANINFESSPIPDVTWLKDGIPVSKRATITNADGMSQLLIPSSERTDTGLYTVTIKNLFGQESFSIEIRVTDEPKPPGPAQLEENVPGTVTVSWVPSPDEKLDSRLHYMVMKRDSIKMSWHTAADHIFNNKFTAVNIMSGRRYFFRVYAKNDMGLSAPSESPAWEICKKKETFSVRMPTYKQNDLRQAPAFIVPLKTHFVPHGYECYMSCAVKGSPKPYVTWYRNNISLNQNANYLVSNVHGVCSMHIMGVSAEDNGEYVVVAENALGRAVCSTRLTVRE